MKDFTYVSPSSIVEVVGLLSENEGCAALLAGGTDLLVQLRNTNSDVDVVIDVKRISQLNDISYDVDNGLSVGAAVSCSQIYQSDIILEKYPIIIDAASIIGGKAIQNRASFGGNVCNSSPSGDAIGAMMALGATCEIVGSNGVRTVPIKEFFIAPGKNILMTDEMLVALKVPAPKQDSGSGYIRFTPRAEMDIAVAGVGSYLEVDRKSDQILSARIALVAVAPTPVLSTSAAQMLVGNTPTENIIQMAASLAQESISPITDVRGTAVQRKHLIGVLTKRSLNLAVSRVKQ
mgnify:CR=1 FL=1|tara:strand:+ start:352 stop:1224 length:873 start_codon:yes stop_codon:yes gene_type:complete